MLIRLFDTESTGLTGIMGELLGYTYKDVGDDNMISYSVNEMDEKAILEFAKEDLEAANIIVGWNSKLHDIPFLNARCAKHGLDVIRPQMHIDLMYYAGGNSLRIGSKKMDNVAKYFKCGNQKTDIDWDVWKEAGRGNEAAIDEVMLHCEQDVRVMEELYWILVRNVKNIHK
jgi:uncharacterized protein YprB with RNaseH-like and TPR domain